MFCTRARSCARTDDAKSCAVGMRNAKPGNHLNKRNVSGRVTLLPGTELTAVSFKKHGAPIFPHFFPVSHTGSIVSSVFFFLSRCKSCLRYTAGNLTNIRACENLQKFCEHEQASTRLICARNSSKGQILRALSNCI